jgi:dihydrofolate reductase
MFSLIAAVGKNKEIGKNKDLVFHLKKDMAFFRKKTLSHKVVMGRVTWDSLPKKLVDRTNIVIDYSNFDGPDLVVKDVDAFIRENSNTDEEIFIIGGGTIYRLFLPYATNLYLTEVDSSDPEATVFFPDFDTKDYDRQIIEKGTENGLNYVISKYHKI